MGFWLRVRRTVLRQLPWGALVTAGMFVIRWQVEHDPALEALKGAVLLGVRWTAWMVAGTLLSDWWRRRRAADSGSGPTDPPPRTPAPGRIRRRGRRRRDPIPTPIAAAHRAATGSTAATGSGPAATSVHDPGYVHDGPSPGPDQYKTAQFATDGTRFGSIRRIPLRRAGAGAGLATLGLLVAVTEVVVAAMGL
ncbi:hypothetical protein FraQA3DRAFT_1698 [Frankia sp. QA3]|nr:hypothetical protein FraQA3DRAFT_1698 [Frankia sp. QA3]